MHPVSLQALRFLENEEGCRLQAYQDTRGVWTIGVGMTTIYGRPVRQGDKLTQADADRLFNVAAQVYQNQMLKLVKVPLTENQIMALLSFAYNEGINAFAGSTLLKKLNAKDYQGAAGEFKNWTRAGNNTTLLAGRRERERRLFLS